MNLYKISSGYANLLALLGDPTMDETIIAAALAEMDGTFEEKAEGYAKVYRTLLAEADAFKVEADRLAALRRTRENNAARLLENMRLGMELAQKTEAKTGIGVWKFKKNPPAVHITDETALPAEYWKIPEPVPVVDKTALSTALKTGAVVPGAELRQGERLEFK